jgi:hypothetical protein
LGGGLPTAVGTTPVTGLIGGSTLSSTITTQVSPAAAMQQGQSFNTSDSPFPRGISDTPASTPSTRLGVTGSTAARILPGTTATTTPATAAAAGGTTPRFGVSTR